MVIYLSGQAEGEPPPFHRRIPAGCVYLIFTVRPLHPAVFEELKRQHDRFSYTGPLTGHAGGVSALAFNRET